jgi:hypothetical protein
VSERESKREGVREAGRGLWTDSLAGRQADGHIENKVEKEKMQNRQKRKEGVGEILLRGQPATGKRFVSFADHRPSRRMNRGQLLVEFQSSF